MPCGAAVSVLLFLLWSLVEVHSQTAPNLTFMGEILPDHSYVDLSALGELDNVDDHVVCHTDLTSCCGGDDFPDRGFWFFPNGDVLPGAAGTGAATNPIVLMRGPQVARLIRGTGPGDAPSGLYRCIIETNADNDPGSPSPSPDNGIGETVYVGVYSTGGDVTIPDGMTLTVDSDLNGASPQFTLTCISTGGPATTVTWTRDSATAIGDEMTSVLDNAETAQYTHTLTVTGSIDGPNTYQCTVSNNKPSQDTANITVRGSPSDLVLIGEENEEYESQDEEYATVEVSWEAALLGDNTSDVTYHLSYFTVEDNELIFQLSKELPPNTISTSVAVRDWYAGLQHLFTVKSVLNTESIVYEGPSLNASIVFDKVYFQLQFGTVDHCISWTKEKAEAIERKLRFEIKEAVFKKCRDCRKLSKSLLRRGVFLCQSQPTMTTYRSSLVSPGLPGLANASSLVRHVQHWVDTAPVVRLDWLLVRINQACPVALRQLSDPECSTPESLANDPQLINTIHGVLNTCAVRSLGAQICQNTAVPG